MYKKNLEETQMKKLLIISVTLLLVTAFQGLALAKSKELSFAAHFGPKNEILREVLQPWAAELEKRTNGEVTVKFYIGQTLAKTADQYDAVVDNIADISWNLHGFNKGRFPLMSVMELPFLSPSAEVGTKALNELYVQFPEMQKEHDDVHLLYLWATLPSQVHSIKKPIKSLEDLKGMKMACTPGMATTVKALGATPVPLPPPKMYEVLEKGVVDGVVLPWASFKVWKLNEVTKYHTKADMGSVTSWSAMNKSVWNSLSPETQAIINEISTDLGIQTAQTVSKHRDIALEKFAQEGHEFFELTEEEKASWIEKTLPITDKWIQDMEKKGYPAKDMVETAQAAVQSQGN